MIAAEPLIQTSRFEYLDCIRLNFIQKGQKENRLQTRTLTTTSTTAKKTTVTTTIIVASRASD